MRFRRSTIRPTHSTDNFTNNPVKDDFTAHLNERIARINRVESKFIDFDFWQTGVHAGSINEHNSKTNLRSRRINLCNKVFKRCTF